MLISFTIKNVFSFKDETAFVLKASSITEHTLDNTFLAPVNEIRILRGAALYGSNASGKSNLFRALNFVIRFVKNSAKESQAKESIPVTNFKLSTQTENQPSSFEIEFINNDTKYRYAFTVDSSLVYSESLYLQKKAKEYLVFTRNKKQIHVEEKYAVANKIKELTRENALFLSTSAMLNVDWASEVIAGFEKFRFFSDPSPNLPFSNDLTSILMEEPEFRPIIMKLLKAGDFGFNDVVSKLLPIKFEDAGIIPDAAQKFFFDNKVRIVSTIHDRLNEHGIPVGKVSFSMFNEESAGTQKFYNLIGPVVEALYRGHILVVDEFTSKLHPLLAEQIIKLFHSNSINRKNAQLLIVTHNTYLLNENIYRRDQIFITEKDNYFSSKLSNLFEMEIRKDAVYEKRYIHDQALGGLPNWNLDPNTFWESEANET